MITLFLRRLFEALRRRHERRATINALSALSDHHLEDIGIARDDIVPLANALERHGGATGVRPQARRIDDGERSSKIGRSAVMSSSATSTRCVQATPSRIPVRY
ncbi:MAG: DUF1127 domain-containing protein [Gammaproteobacteria bacterium]|nr:DUF1127 domain-containing protein [Gammaproteobacteria bacterium]